MCELVGREADGSVGEVTYRERERLEADLGGYIELALQRRVLRRHSTW